MTPWHDDQEIRKAFEDVHKYGGDDVPEFDDVWRRSKLASQRRTASHRRRWRVFAAAVSATAIFIVYWSARRDVVAPSKPPMLTEWKAPTDFLLQMPNRELLSGIPRIPSPGLDEAIQTLSRTSKGR